MKQLVFAIISCCSLPFAVYSQNRLSLKECIEYGMKNHRSKTVYSNERLAAEAQAKEALAAYLPNISVNGSVDDNLKVQESVIPAGLFGPTDTKVAFTKKFNSTGTIQLDQTVYDQSLITGLKANKVNKQQAELNVVQNDESLIYNISTAYYQIFVYREQVEFLKNNQQSYVEQLRITKLQVEKGVTMENDLNKIQVNYNNNQSDIYAAETDLIVAENQLKNAMGYPLSNPLHIDTAEGQIASALLGTDTTTFFAGNRVEYKLAEVNTRLLSIDEKRIQAGALPVISVYGRYGGVGFGDKLGESLSTVSDFSAIGLKLSVPLFDGFKRGAQRNQARYKRLNSLEALRLDADKYRLEFENARTKLVKAQRNVDNDRKNIDLAISVFKSTDLQYQKGVTDLTEWITAQNAVREAQNNYLSSLYNYYLATVDLQKANGTLTSFYNSL